MSRSTSNRKSTSAVCAALMVATVVTYWPVTGHQFLSWDDNDHVAENEHVQSGLTWDNFIWSWGIHGPSQWHPLSWWTHQLDCQLFGSAEQAAGRHHATNLLWHTLAAIMLLLALRRLTAELWPSATVAALFALHPLSVESVAWLAERRDVLSAFFFALTLWAYAGYAQRGGGARYTLVMLSLALGLMAKPMLVTLPCVLLLLDYWPLRRIAGMTPSNQPASGNFIPSPQQSATWLVIEKLPLLVLCGISAWLSYQCQLAAHAVQSLEQFSLSSRLANGALSYVLYLRNMVWPWRLGPMYPWPESFVPWEVAAAALLLLGVTAAAVWLAQRRPYLLVGWLWYLGMLLPVIGLLRMGVAVAMADRWVYLPLIGVYLAVVWGLRDVLRALNARAAAVATVAVVVLVPCAVLTRRQVHYWQDNIALFTRAIEIDKNVPVAHLNLGIALHGLGQRDEAVTHYKEALRLQPKLAAAHYNWGAALAELGHPDEAMVHYEEALRINPRLPEAHNNWGNTLLDLHDYEEAIDHYQQALQIDPRLAEAHFNWGNALLQLKRFTDAADHYRQALSIAPDYAEAHFNWGNALVNQRRFEDAVVHYREALRLNPDFTLARDNLRRTEALLQQKKRAGD